MHGKYVDVTELLGKTLVSVENHDDESITFVTDSGEEYCMYHDQGCCESVTVEDICGDLNDLVGSPIVMAEEAVSCNENPEGVPVPDSIKIVSLGPSISSQR